MKAKWHIVGYSLCVAAAFAAGGVVMKARRGEGGLGERPGVGVDSGPRGLSGEGEAAKRGVELSGEWMRLEIDCVALGESEGQLAAGRVLVRFGELVEQDPAGALVFVEKMKRYGIAGRLLEVMAEQLPLEHAGEFIRLLGAVDLEHVPESAQYVFFARVWARDGLDGAMKLFASLPGATARGFVDNAIHGLAEREPKLAIEYAAGMAEGVKRTRFLHFIAQVLGRRDPAAAREWMASLKGEEAAAARSGFVMSRLVEDPMGALRLVSEWDVKLDQNSRLKLAMRLAIHRPLTEVESAIRGLSGSATVQQLLPALVIQVAEQDGARAAEVVALMENKQARHASAEMLMAKWSSVDPAAALSWLSQSSPELVGVALLNPSTVRNLAGFAPEATAELSRHLTIMDASLRAFMVIGGALAAKDKEAAAAWCRGLETPKAAAAAAEGVMRALTANGTGPEALGFAGGFPVGSEMRTQAVRVLGEAAFRFPEAVSRVESGLSGDDLVTYREAAGEVVAWRALPDEVLGKIEDSMVLTGGNVAGARRQLEQWAKTQPAAAAEWLKAAPEGGWVNGVAEAAVGSWFGREPMEAAKWVGALPVGRLRSAGALVIAKGLVESDPEMAGQWLQQAGDDPGRAAVQEMLDGRR